MVSRLEKEREREGGGGRGREGGRERKTEDTSFYFALYRNKFS